MARMIEIWKSIKGYEGHYEISNYGRVKSLERLIRFRGKKEYFRLYPEIILKTGNIKNYLIVNLCINGYSKYYYIHFLVANTFIGKRPRGLDISHKDGIKSNNHIDNLEYVTTSENCKNTFRLGYKSFHGENHPMSKLKEEQILEIRRWYHKHKIFMSELAIGYKVTPQNINRIIKRKTWRHI